MSVNWRVWLRNALEASAPLSALILPQYMFPAGALVGAPGKKPFLVVRLDPKVPGPAPGLVFQDSTINVHDEPGTYLDIQEIIELVKAAINVAPRTAGVSGALWTGDSGDLADDGYGTIFRSTSHRLAERE